MRCARAVVLVLATVSSASADDAPAAAPDVRPPAFPSAADVAASTTEPILPNIPVMSAGLVIDLRLDYTDYADEGDPNIVGLVPSVQYTDPIGFGGWLTLPALMLESYSPGNGATQKQLGAASLGGLYTYRGPLDVTARLGLGVPLSGDRSVPRGATASRPIDFAVQSGEAMWLHTGIAAQFRYGPLCLGSTAVVDVPMFAQSDYDGYVSASRSATFAATAGLQHKRIGASASAALYEPIDDHDFNRFVTLDALVDVIASRRVRVFLAYGITDFGTGAYSFSAGARFWR